VNQVGRLWGITPQKNAKSGLTKSQSASVGYAPEGSRSQQTPHSSGEGQAHSASSSNRPRHDPLQAHLVARTGSRPVLYALALRSRSGPTDRGVRATPFAAETCQSLLPTGARVNAASLARRTPFCVTRSRWERTRNVSRGCGNRCASRKEAQLQSQDRPGVPTNRWLPARTKTLNDVGVPCWISWRRDDVFEADICRSSYGQLAP